MTAKQENACAVIIHVAAAASGTVGAIPIPFADELPISGAQVLMIIGLGKVFGIEFTKSAASSLALTYVASKVGRGISKAVLSFIPVFGWVANAAIAGGLTEAMGWAIANEFDRVAAEKTNGGETEAVADIVTRFVDKAK